MKSHNIIRIAGMAAVGMAFAMNARAATTSYSTDDLLIGFVKSGSAKDYVIDVGQASNFTGQTWTPQSLTIIIGNIGADLAATFGNGWATDSTISWGVVGTTRASTVGSDGPYTVYASKDGEAYTNFVNSTGWGTYSQNQLSGAASRITSAGSAYSGKSSTANSNVGVVQNNISTAINSAFASYQPGGANATNGAAGLSFDLFSPSILGSNASGISADTLGLFQMAPNQLAQPVTDFTISSAGVISYTSVPEPASVSLGLLGATLAFVRRRRF